LNPTSTRYCS